MFSRRIVNSARFLKMTTDAQLLYFHLALAADDDGIVEAFAVRQMVGAKEDTFSNLQGRGFITVLDAENEIIYINDWYEHNKLRADRITPSIHRGLLQRNVPEVALIEPRQRKDRPAKTDAIDVTAGKNGYGTDEGQPLDDHGTSQRGPGGVHGTALGRPGDGHGPGMGQSLDRLRQDKLSKDKISEDKTGEDKRDDGTIVPSPPRFFRPSISEIKDYCQEKGYAHVDAEYFWNYYENIGWRIGKGKAKMKNWKLAVANWEKRQIEFEREKAMTQRQTAAGFEHHTEAENSEDWGWD